MWQRSIRRLGKQGRAETIVAHFWHCFGKPVPLLWVCGYQTTFFFIKSPRNLPLEIVNLLVQIYVLLGPYIFLIISVLLWDFHFIHQPLGVEHLR